MNEQLKNPTLVTIASLLHALHAEAIRYVHWKSNINIGKALLGQDDLDLLVHPGDATAFEAIIARIGFQRALSHKDRWQPNMYHFFCPDPASGTMVHLHLHYALTLGYDFHKNFTLPIVDWYLDGRVNSVGMYVPRPEREYIVYVIRLLIKHARSTTVIEFPRRQIQMLRARRTSAISKNERLEFDLLREAADPADIAPALEAMGLGISPAIFAGFETMIANGAAHRAFYAEAARLKRLIASTRQTGEATSLALAFGRITMQRLRTILVKLRLARPQKKTNSTGGRIIAFIGGDGAGKSTNVEALYRALRRGFDTQMFHVGRPGRSVPGLAASLAGSAMALLGRRADAQAFKNLALAYNRVAAFGRAEALRDHGGIAILDRLPNPQISTMDSPRIHEAHNRLQSRLQSKERALYDRIGGVDLVIVLRLDPEIACQRRPEDDRPTLLQRSGEVWNGVWTQPYMFSIDTGAHGMDEVRQAVLDRAWSCVRAPLICCEIVGLSGAGKSTVIKALRQSLSNVRTSLPYRRYPFALFGASLRQLFASGVPMSALDRQIFRNFVQLRLTPMIARKWENDGRPSHNYILDQGPVFQMLLALREGKISPQASAFAPLLEATGQVLSDGVVMLEASDAVLQQRMIERSEQPDRATRMSAAERDAFYQSYHKAFGEVLPHLSVVAKVNAEAAPADVIAAVWAILGKDKRS